ncbi:MAG: L-2-amino-thiazoline-4-carboxylic acid hydrolase [bacterium]
MTEPTITHLERRKIEAGVMIPMVQAFQRAMGREAANAIAKQVIVELARRDGERWAAQFGDDLAAVERVACMWAAGGGLEIEPVAAPVPSTPSQQSLDFNVTRCRYAELYKELGLPELGYLFHCNRDFAMIEGFNRKIALTRTQTIMEGAAHCDFRFRSET